MMRWLFACLIVLVLASAPVAAGAGLASCDHASNAIQMAGAHGSMAPKSPCAHNQKAAPDCGKPCDLLGAMGLPSPAHSGFLTRYAVEASAAVVPVAAIRPFAPSALDPPPRPRA